MLDRWLEEATPDRREVQVCFDRALLSRLDQAKARHIEIATNKMLGDEEKVALRAEIEQLQAEVKDKTRTFVFEGIGWGQWRKLVAAHPPSPDQAEVFQRAIALSLLPRGFGEIEVDETTFVPAAMAASCKEPGLTPEQALTMIEKLPTGVIDRLWEAVLRVNHAGKDDPFVLTPIGFVEALVSAKK